MRLDYRKFTFEYDNLIPVRTVFTYTLPTKHDIKIFLHIEERLEGEDREQSTVEAVLMKKLRHAEFTVVDKKGFANRSVQLSKSSVEEVVSQLSSLCDIAIIGTVDARKKSEFGGMFFAESRGAIKIISTKNATVLKAVTITPKLSKSDMGVDTKGAGLNMVTAEQNSLAKAAEVIAQETVIQREEAFNTGLKSR